MLPPGEGVRFRGVWVVDIDKGDVCAERRFPALERHHAVGAPVGGLPAADIALRAVEAMAVRSSAVAACGSADGPSPADLLPALSSPHMLDAVVVDCSNGLPATIGPIVAFAAHRGARWCFDGGDVEAAAAEGADALEGLVLLQEDHPAHAATNNVWIIAAPLVTQTVTDTPAGVQAVLAAAVVVLKAAVGPLVDSVAVMAPFSPTLDAHEEIDALVAAHAEHLSRCAQRQVVSDLHWRRALGTLFRAGMAAGRFLSSVPAPTCAPQLPCAHEGVAKTAGGGLALSPSHHFGGVQLRAAPQSAPLDDDYMHVDDGSADGQDSPSGRALLGTQACLFVEQCVAAQRFGNPAHDNMSLCCDVVLLPTARREHDAAVPLPELCLVGGVPPPHAWLWESAVHGQAAGTVPAPPPPHVHIGVDRRLVGQTIGVEGPLATPRPAPFALRGQALLDRRHDDPSGAAAVLSQAAGRFVSSGVWRHRPLHAALPSSSSVMGLTGRQLTVSPEQSFPPLSALVLAEPCADVACAGPSPPLRLLTTTHEIPRYASNVSQPGPSAFGGSYALLPVLDAHQAGRLLQELTFRTGVAMDATCDEVARRDRSDQRAAREWAANWATVPGHVLYELDLTIQLELGTVAAADVPRLEVVFSMMGGSSVVYFHLEPRRLLDKKWEPLTTNLHAQQLSDAQLLLSWLGGLGNRVPNGTTINVRGVVVCDLTARPDAGCLTGDGGHRSGNAVVDAVTTYSSASLHFTLLAERPFLPGSFAMLELATIGRLLTDGKAASVAAPGPAPDDADGAWGALYSRLRSSAFGAPAEGEHAKRWYRLGLPTEAPLACADDPAVWARSLCTQPAPVSVATVVRSHPEKGFVFWNYGGNA